MNQIGRKIYYELSTGNVIFTRESRNGAVIDTSIEQDFQMYSNLQPYLQSAVGSIQLAYGQDEQNFDKYPYHVDISQNPPVIAWDTANPIGASLVDVQNNKIAQLNDMYNQCLKTGFHVTLNGTSYVCGATAADRGNMTATQDAIDNAFVTFPFDYADIYGGKIPLNSQTDFDVIKQMAAKFGFAQHQQILDLIAQVRAIREVDYATKQDSINAVNAIQWTVATY